MNERINSNLLNKMTILIRHARKEDRFAIKALVYRAYLNPISLKWHRFIVAECDGKIVGARQIKILRDGTREVASGVVSPSYRRQGISRKMMETILAKEKEPLYLMCDKKWSSYYRQFGFYEEPLHQLPNAFLWEFRIMSFVYRIASRLILCEKLSMATMKRTP